MMLWIWVVQLTIWRQFGKAKCSMFSHFNVQIHQSCFMHFFLFLLCLYARKLPEPQDSKCTSAKSCYWFQVWLVCKSMHRLWCHHLCPAWSSFLNIFGQYNSHNSRSFDLSIWMVYPTLLLVVLFIQIFCCSFHCLPFTMGINTKNSYIFQSWDATSISLSAACDLFMRFVTRTSHLEHEKFDAAKSRLIERGEKFGEISLKVITQSRTFILVYILKFMPFFWCFDVMRFQARKTIAMLSQDFIYDGCTMLVHGYSRVVLEVLKLAASNHKLFRVLCTGTEIQLQYVIFQHNKIIMGMKYTLHESAIWFVNNL